jgi:hypothetical protein
MYVCISYTIHRIRVPVSVGRVRPSLHLALFPAGGPFLPSLSVNFDMMASQVPLVASDQMSKTYQASEALDLTPRLSIKCAASEVGANQGLKGDPTTNIVVFFQAGFRTFNM